MLAGRFFAYVSITELVVHTVQLSAIRFDVRIDEEIERLSLLARRENDVATLREFHPTLVVSTEVVLPYRTR